MYYGRGIRIKSPCLCCAVAEPTRLLHGIVNLTPPCNNTRVIIIIIIIGRIFRRQRETGRRCPFDDARAGDTVVSVQNPRRSLDTPDAPATSEVHGWYVFLCSAPNKRRCRTRQQHSPEKRRKKCIFLLTFLFVNYVKTHNGTIEKFDTALAVINNNKVHNTIDKYKNILSECRDLPCGNDK